MRIGKRTWIDLWLHFRRPFMSPRFRTWAKRDGSRFWHVGAGPLSLGVMRRP